MKKLFLIMVMVLALSGFAYAAGFDGNNMFFTDSYGKSYTVKPPGSAGTMAINPAEGSIVFEGDTDDDYETQLQVVDPTKDVFYTMTVPTDTACAATGTACALIPSTLATNGVGAANSIWGESGKLVFEGSTADASEASISAANVTADVNVIIPNAAAATYSMILSTLATNAPDIANSVTGGTNQLIFEGATADDYETIITPTDATADRTLTLPNLSGTVGLILGTGANVSLPSTLATNGVDVVNSVWGGTNQLIFEGATDNAFETIITPTDPTADRTITLPNVTGLVSLATSGTALSASTTINQDFSVGNLFTDTPTDNENQTINATTIGASGTVITIVFTAVGTADEVITFGTGFHSTGTLTIDTTASRYYTITFISDGSVYYEIARTAVQT